MTRFVTRALCILAGATLAASCAVGPDYHRPPMETAANYKESSDWKPSEPNDVLSRGPWWKIFNDDVLNDLTEKLS